MSVGSLPCWSLTCFPNGRSLMSFNALIQVSACVGLMLDPIFQLVYTGWTSFPIFSSHSIGWSLKLFSQVLSCRHTSVWILQSQSHVDVRYKESLLKTMLNRAFKAFFELATVPPRMWTSHGDFLSTFLKLFVLLLSSLSYFSFYHLPFVTLSTYLHIFITFHILSCNTSYIQSSIHFF